jgi:lysophospholipid acyltransferase (LPLAT)-like uncharacterized protein
MKVARWAIDLLAPSWRYETEGESHLRRLRANGNRLLYAVWHGALLPALWRHRGESTTLLVSQHRDGGRLASTVAGWGYRVVRGSSTRGSVVGLLGLMRALRSGGDVAVTPDGPKGPARIAKPGAIAAAQRTGAAIVPVATAASSAWRARSWDGFFVPRPFAQVRVVYEEPFTVGDGAAAFAEGLCRLQESLARATKRAEGCR